MSKMMSVCGVLCSDCPAYLGRAKGLAHQERTASAWQRIYGLSVSAESITCGGCLGPDEELFYTSQNCKARLCCLSKGFGNCAECFVESCQDLEQAQSLWDGVPDLVGVLSHEDFATYAQPYCGHRQRLADARTSRR